ncbi:MAG: hypothetical protein QXT58_04830 [Archaeoglobaceae archaeon]
MAKQKQREEQGFNPLPKELPPLSDEAEEGIAENMGGEEVAIVPVPTPAALPSPISLNESILQDGRKELNGWEEFASSSLFWVSLNPQKGVIECRRLGLEWSEILCQIVDCRVIRVAKDNEGVVFCYSLDREQATERNPYYEGTTVCAECPYRDRECSHRWWIAFVVPEYPDILLAHTLSRMGSLNFHIYAHKLIREGLSPSQVLTRIFVEEARRRKQGTLYRRLAFEKVGEL